MRRLILAAALAALAAPASATDFTQPVLGLDGKPIADCPAGKPDCGETLTLSRAVTVALTMQTNVQPADKFKRFLLAQKVYDAKDVSLSAEEIALAKEAVAATMTPVVVGRVFLTLDPNSAKK